MEPDTDTALIGAGFATIYPLVAEKIGHRFTYYHPGLFNGIFSFAMVGAMLAPWLLPLESLDIRLDEGDAGGADLTPMDGALVPLVSVHPDVTHYFDIHHSAADTLDKIDPENLAKNAAAIAVVAYALAEMPATLPRPAARPATH